MAYIQPPPHILFPPKPRNEEERLAQIAQWREYVRRESRHLAIQWAILGFGLWAICAMLAYMAWKSL